MSNRKWPRGGVKLFPHYSLGKIIFSKLTITLSVDCADSYSQPHPCPIHRNWVDSSKALDDSTRFARYVSTRFARSSSRKSTTGMTNRQQGKRFVSIRSNRLESTTFSSHPQSPDQLYGIGFTNRFPVCRIANTKDESTLVGCIGQPYQPRFLVSLAWEQLWRSVGASWANARLHSTIALIITH